MLHIILCIYQILHKSFPQFGAWFTETDWQQLQHTHKYYNGAIFLNALETISPADFIGTKGWLYCTTNNAVKQAGQELLSHLTGENTEIQNLGHLSKVTQLVRGWAGAQPRYPGPGPEDFLFMFLY